MYASSWATATSDSTTPDVRPAVTKIFTHCRGETVR